MKRQSGYAGFPAILLTFSLLLLVLAIGFVVGRAVVARAYLDKAPRFDVEAAQAPDVSSDPGQQRSAVPGRVYVPPPAPPPEAPDRRDSMPGEGEGGESRSEPGEPPAAADGEGGGATTPAPAPAPASSGEATPRPQPAPRPPKPAVPEKESQQQAYSIQVGIFTSRQGARQVVDDLARAGFSATISREKRGSQELYRVVTGGYRSEYAARKAVEELRKEGFEAFLIQQ